VIKQQLTSSRALHQRLFAQMADSLLLIDFRCGLRQINNTSKVLMELRRNIASSKAENLTYQKSILNYSQRILVIL